MTIAEIYKETMKRKDALRAKLLSLCMEAGAEGDKEKAKHYSELADEVNEVFAPLAGRAGDQ